MSRYPDQVWEAVTALGHEAKDVLRSGYGPLLERLESDGVAPGRAAELVLKRMEEARDDFRMALEAFELLKRSVEVIEADVRAWTQDERDPEEAIPRLLTLMVQAQTGIARLIHGMARLAPLAGVSTGPSRQEAEQILAEALEEQLVRFAQMVKQGIDIPE